MDFELKEYDWWATLGAIPCKFNFGLQGQLYSAKAKSPKINGNDQYT